MVEILQLVYFVQYDCMVDVDVWCGWIEVEFDVQWCVCGCVVCEFLCEFFFDQQFVDVVFCDGECMLDFVGDWENGFGIGFGVYWCQEECCKNRDFFIICVCIV